MADWEVGYGTSDFKGNAGDGGNGLFTNLTTVRFRDVTDGLSQTIAIAESSYPGQAGDMWPYWIGIMEHWEQNIVMLTWSRINCVPGFGGQFWMFASGNNCALSLHPGSAHFLMADGAVVSLPETIDRRTYRALARRNDGEVTGISF
jgi:prepilin-type processing-associated H-X9-DG protein